MSEPARQLPALDHDTAFFWEAGADGVLRIQRCGTCGRYQHPPFPRCPACGGENLAPAPVSGKARVASFTINEQAWRPGLAVPYVFAAVELAEQAELYVMTNIVDCAVEEVAIGMPVAVRFSQQEDVWLPMFAPPKADNA